MNEQQRNREVEQGLASWMDRAAPNQAPSRLLEGTFAETMRSRQARTYPWHRITLPRLVGRKRAPATRLLIALGVILILALAITLAGGGSGLPAAPTGGASPTQPTSQAPTPAARSPELPPSVSITADRSVPVPDLLGYEMDGTQLWGLTPGTIVRVDLTTGTVTNSVALGGAADLYNGFASNDVGLWAADSDNQTLYRVDRTTFEVVARITAGFAPKGVLANADGVWVADVHYGTVLRVDPATNTIAATISVGPTGPSGPNWLASGLGSIWTDIPNNGTIVRIDPLTDKVQATIKTPAGFTGCGGIAIGTAAVWVSGCSASAAVGRFDPTTNLAVAVVTLPGYGGPTLIDDVPWVSVDTGDENAGLLVRIDAATNTIDRVLVPDVPFGGGGGIMIVGASVWIHDWSHQRLLRFPLAAFGA
jgi:sugar lactone lactonase YvrE